MSDQKTISRFTYDGLTIYCLPIQSFPDHYTNVYLVCTGDTVALIDLGSGWGDSNTELVKGLEEIRDRFGEKVTLGDIDLLMLTHGHIDHFGGLAFFRAHSKAKVAIHELDARQIINFEETILVVARDLKLFLKTVGISEHTQQSLMEMYTAGKNALASVPIDFYLREGEPALGGGAFRIYHTPGHCPGAVCIQAGACLFTGDHILSDISPHQSPETIARYTGLGHYLASLEKIKAVPGLEIAFGGHQSVMEDVYGRIEAIERLHEERLAAILDICREPHSVKEISSRLFSDVSGYTVLLALEETGAHVEYLYQRGRLAIENLKDLERDLNPIIYYRTR
jgi:glyoxylase-like metal-dependent hydrolase (beta-lactamase superfamily II)